MDDNIPAEKVKRGYLNEDFLFFNLKDQQRNEFQFHYHDFYKIIVFISGEVTYIIEGKSYKLKPWDILLVGRNDIHMPIISSVTPYERMILWMNPIFLERHNKNDCDLLNCFHLASSIKLNLVRLNAREMASIRQILAELQYAMKDNSFGSSILRNSIFLQFMVKVNRLFLQMDTGKKIGDIKYDKNIEAVLSYINSNLNSDLSVETVAKKFYLNKYYLMHLFKNEAGYTLHSYVQKKRLMKASILIKNGLQASEACLSCGFNDYSSFVRAFKKEFGLSPRQYCKFTL